MLGLFRPQLQSLALNSFVFLHEAKLDSRGLRDADVRCLWTSNCRGLHCVSLNGNRLRTLPKELGLLANLQVRNLLLLLIVTVGF